MTLLPLLLAANLLGHGLVDLQDSRSIPLEISGDQRVSFLVGLPNGSRHLTLYGGSLPELLNCEIGRQQLSLHPLLMSPLKMAIPQGDASRDQSSNENANDCVETRIVRHDKIPSGAWALLGSAIGSALVMVGFFLGCDTKGSNR